MQTTNSKVVYRFVCYCGCGQLSEPLNKEYKRLRKGLNWSAKGCEAEKEVVREFKGGFIIKDSDF